MIPKLLEGKGEILSKVDFGLKFTHVHAQPNLAQAWGLGLVWV